MLKIIVFCLAIIVSQARELPSDSKIQGRLNIVNGASAECVMHRFYTDSGWTKIEGQIGRGGIDGLYYKLQGGKIKEVLVAESKWNKSRLGLSGKGKTVKQMSQEWVLRTLDKLIKKMDDHTYRVIRTFISNNQYRARLFRMKPVGKNSIQISVFSIKNKGLKAFDEIRDTQLSPIDINAPKNSFERGIVQAYNDCRSVYLHKYFTFLSDRDIGSLLKTNHIKKSDVRKLIQ